MYTSLTCLMSMSAWRLELAEELKAPLTLIRKICRFSLIEPRRVGTCKQSRAQREGRAPVTETSSAAKTMSYSGYHRNKAPQPDLVLSQVGPATPGGEYQRRFWHPVAY